MCMFGETKVLNALTNEEFDKAVRMPFFAEAVITNIDGKPAKRLMIGLKAPGCAYRRTARAKGLKQCPFCVLSDYYSTAGRKVRTEQFMDQISWAMNLPESKEAERIEVFNAGSFLEDSEVSSEARLAIVGYLASIKTIRSILIEAKATDLLGNKITELDNLLYEIYKTNLLCSLEIAIGLEVTDEEVSRAIGKSSKKVLANLMQELAKRGVKVQFYALIKPVLMSESEAVDSAVKTIAEVSEISATLNLMSELKPRISLSPTRIYKGSELASMPEYKTTTLWSVVEVIRQSANAGYLKNLSLQIGLSDEGIEIVENGNPSNCGKCDEVVLKALKVFNATESLEVMNNALAHVDDCPCQKEKR